jgi:hypothetical protein
MNQPRDPRIGAANFQLEPGRTGCTLRFGNQLTMMIRTSFFLFITLLVAAGCQAPRDVYPTGLVHVEFTGPTPDQIREVTRAVMRENGYTEASVFHYDMVFERRASKGDTRMYGSIAPEQGWERVYLRIRRKLDGTLLLDCDAFLVEYRGEDMYETEQAFGFSRRGRYRELLEQVQQQLMPAAKPIEPEANQP